MWILYYRRKKGAFQAKDPPGSPELDQGYKFRDTNDRINRMKNQALQSKMSIRVNEAYISGNGRYSKFYLSWSFVSEKCVPGYVSILLKISCTSFKISVSIRGFFYGLPKGKYLLFTQINILVHRISNLLLDVFTFSMLLFMSLPKY